MRRLPKTHKKLPMKKEDEPDFYKLDKSNPLPTLEEAPLPSSTIVPPLRPQQGIPGGMVPPMHGIGAPGGMPAAFKESYGPRDGLMGMGMGQGLPPNGFVNPAMGMNPMNAGLAGMNPMNGIDNLRDPQFAQQGMGDFGPHFGGPSSAQLDYQRFRQLQLLERQMGGPGPMMSNQMMSNDPFAMMRQQC